MARRNSDTALINFLLLCLDTPEQFDNEPDDDDDEESGDPIETTDPLGLDDPDNWIDESEE